MLYVNDASPYRAGACNIGPAEIARRRRSGIAALLTAVTLALLMLVAETNTVLRWIVAVPLAWGLIGLVQAQLRFCVAYGLAGMRNFGPLGTRERVEETDAVRADRRRALMIMAAVTLVAVAITALYVAIPL